MRIVYPWLCDLVQMPVDADTAAREISLRGFEIADLIAGRMPVIDFEVTANRPDCLSHLGFAREASTIWNTPLVAPDATIPEYGPAEDLDVELRDPDLCPRYCAQVFEVRVGPSPEWLAERLEAAGVRPISNIVDITNYVMLEMGQPMHAFDLRRLAGRRLIIRRAATGEAMTTLDGVPRSLDAEMLVIADAERAQAIGGVMGGHDSEIDGTTRLMALESAYFHPPSVRRTSKRLGLKTEASIRFERGGDVNAPPAGIARAAALMHRIGAGRPLGALIDRYPSPKPAVQLTLRASRIARLLGQAVPDAEVPRILEPLGFRVTGGRSEDERTWRVGVPTFRVDITREADLIEEVGRHHGFDRLPVTFPALSAPQAPPAPDIARDRLLRQVLAASGCSEAMTFAFIERAAALPFCEPGKEPAAIANPLSEKFAVLRPSLLPGLLDSLVHNRRRERKDVRLFELGSRFTPEGEGRAVAFAWCGAASGPHWSAPTRNVDFFDVKGIVEQLCAAFRIAPQFTPTERPYLVRGRAAAAITEANGMRVTLGVVGQLLPAVAEARGFPGTEEIYAAELDAIALARHATTADLRAEPLPRFPSIVRDVSILIDDTLPAATVRGTIRAAAPPTLVSIAEFDRYQGKGVPEGRISLSLRLTFRASDRTLTDDEAQGATERIVEALKQAHGAERR